MAPEHGNRGGATQTGDAQITLSAGAVARRLGVAVETLRSWDQRYGLGPELHRPGAHRRYAPADVARLEAFCRLIGEGVPTADAARVVLADGLLSTKDGGVAASAQIAAPSTGQQRGGGGSTLPIGRAGVPSARGLARCAIRLDAPGVLHLLEKAIMRDGVVTAWQEMIEPALRAVGRKWTESSGRHVEVEHLLSWCATVALHRVRPGTAEPSAASGPRPIAARGVLLACAPDEWHSLPLEALAAALAERAVPICMLGPAVPEAALQAAVSRIDPVRVVVWSQTSRTANSGLLVNLTRTLGGRVLPAGPGWTASRSAGIRVLSSLADAVDACAAS